MYKIRWQGNYTLTHFNIVRAIKDRSNRNKAVTANDRGEYIMQQVDTIQLVPKFASIFNWLALFFGSPRISTPQPDQVISQFDWSDSDLEQSCSGSDNQPVSGGYNEAFIIQHWSSYPLR